ncbi:hypothetical protein ACKFKG_29400 [Phormidesmis sp. 146-35]
MTIATLFFVKTATFTTNITTFATNITTFTTNITTFATNALIFSANLRIVARSLWKTMRCDPQTSQKQHNLLREPLNQFLNDSRQTRTVQNPKKEPSTMPRAQRTSRILDKGQLRILKLKAIDPNLSFGSDRNLSTLETQIKQLHTKLNDYNTTIASLDIAKQEIDQMERDLGDLLDQLLNGVSAKYGNDSREYEMAGGTRKSDRVRKSAQSRTKNNVTKLATGMSIVLCQR